MFINVKFKFDTTLPIFSAQPPETIEGELRVKGGDSYDFRHHKVANYYRLELPFNRVMTVHESLVIIGEPETIRVSWDYTDVLSAVGLESGDSAYVEHAKQVLKSVFKYHDANVGINWDVLRTLWDVVDVKP